MKILCCPDCFLCQGIRIIIWGMPLEEPDPQKFVCGGCCADNETPELRCITCGWEGYEFQAEKAGRSRRFIWTDEDRGGFN